MNFFFIFKVIVGGAIACLISNSTPVDGFTTTMTMTKTLTTKTIATTTKTQPTILTMTTNEFSKTDNIIVKNSNVSKKQQHRHSTIGTVAESATATATASRRDILSTVVRQVTGSVAAAATLSSVQAVLNTVVDNTNNNFVSNAAEVVTTTATATTTATSSYPTITGIYTDPKYPNGYRILIKKSEGFATLSYSNGDTNVYTNQRVKINQDQSLTFDFSFQQKEGGQKKNVVVGIVDKEDGNSISFPDGTKWTRKDIYQSIEGVYGTDPRVATQGYRTVIIRKQKQSDKNNNNVLVVELNKIKTITATITSDNNKKKKNGVDSTSILFDFVPGDEQKKIEGTFQNGIISFPVPVQSNSYGNTFTKWDKWVKVGIQAYN